MCRHDLSDCPLERSRHRWSFYFPIWQFTHSVVFIGQDHRTPRNTTLGTERLSAWDRDVVTWRRFAVENARGYLQRDAATNGHDKVNGHTNGHAEADENGAGMIEPVSVAPATNP